MSLSSAVPASIRQLLLEHSAGRGLWLVGGAIRDSLLNRPSQDLDFVVDGEARPLARTLATALEGHYFDLDAERDAGRIVRPARAEGVATLDFARLRGSSILEDLVGRDFTINALATALDAPDQLVDSGSGLQDLRDRRLRACSPQAMQDDPVRSLRGVRLALELDLSMVSATKSQIRQAGPLLGQVAAERIRDEFMQMLKPALAGRSVRLLERLELLWHICPDLRGLREAAGPGRDAWQHTLTALERAADILNVLVGRLPGGLSENLTIGEAALHLGRYREQLADVMGESLAGERRVEQIFCLAVLYHAAGWPDEPSDSATQAAEEGPRLAASRAARRCRELRLSSAEGRLVESMIRHHRLPRRYPEEEGLTPLAVHRYFRSAGKAGVLAALLHLADFLADQAPPASLTPWRERLVVVRALLEARFERSKELLEPPLLLRGDELIAELNLKPGPAVGAMLSALAEAQVQGSVQTRVQALDFVHRWRDLATAGGQI
jgi:tRNA nucleotidyltransferase/poly(A) polymerase